jgi:ABC-type microcin C transport system permease subunit YejE
LRLAAVREWSFSTTSESDQTRIEIAKLTIEAGRLGVQMATIVERMNRDNNSFWKWIVGVLGVVAITIIVIFAGTSRRDEA